MKVAIFIPCFIDQLYPKTGFNFVKILEKAGCEVVYNEKQTCCGQPAFNSGYWNEAQELAIKFIDDFDVPYPIVSPSGSCTGYIRNHYSELLKNTIHHAKSERIRNNVFEMTDFLVNHLKITDLGATLAKKVTYHDSCAALREYGIKQEPRILLQHVKGLELVEMEQSDTCCGFGGTFAVKHSAISSAMVEQKLVFATKTEAEIITTTEASCLMNIEGYIKKNNIKIQAMHIADILASGL